MKALTPVSTAFPWESVITTLVIAVETVCVSVRSVSANASTPEVASVVSSGPPATFLPAANAIVGATSNCVVIVPSDCVA